MTRFEGFFNGLELNFFSVQNFTLNNALDIFIVSFFIYYAMIWAKTTRVWSLFKGVLVLLTIYVFSYIFHLYTVTWIINNTLSVGVIAVMILFQPEIRAALEQLGRNSKLDFFDNKEINIHAKTVDEIVVACREMSKTKTGALIVIEQKTKLNNVIETGIVIEGIVSNQLIQNIFEYKTPLHDGAIVIRENKVMAASCILPLSSQNLDKSLGTRHRAGVGMSEISDAYIVVVSEESGKLSLVYDGNLYKDINEEELRKKIVFNTEINKKVKIKIRKPRKRK